MDTETNPEAGHRRPRRLREYVLCELAAAHRRRPASFYSLTAIPLVLLLGAHMGKLQDSPRHFFLLLTLLFVFFFIVMAHAVNDVFQLCRKHYAAQRTAYLETIGDGEFVRRLGKGVRDRQPPY